MKKNKKPYKYIRKGERLEQEIQKLERELIELKYRLRNKKD